jgi:hypothetical protein
MADETLQQQPPTFSDELYKYAHDSGFIPKEATVDIFKKNLSNKDFVKELYDYSVQTEFIPKEATIDIFTKNIGGVEPSKKKDTVSPVDGGSSGLQKIKFNGQEYGYNADTLQAFKPDGTEIKQVKISGKIYDVKDFITNVIGIKPKQVDNTEYDYKSGFADRQQGAINSAMSPDVQSEKLIKRNKKFPSFKDNPKIGAALDAYQNLKTAAANTADKQDEYDLFLKTGTFTDENGQDIRPCLPIGLVMYLLFLIVPQQT